MPGHQYTSTPVQLYAITPAYKCQYTYMHCACMPARLYTSMAVCYYTSMPILRYTFMLASIPLCVYASKPVCLYTSTPVCQYACTPIRLYCCAGILVYKFYMVVDCACGPPHARPHRTTPFLIMRLMALSAMMIECQQFIYLLFIYSFILYLMVSFLPSP